LLGVREEGEPYHPSAVKWAEDLCKFEFIQDVKARPKGLDASVLSFVWTFSASLDLQGPVSFSAFLVVGVRLGIHDVRRLGGIHSPCD
jgi:hypothetical protein